MSPRLVARDEAAQLDRAENGWLDTARERLRRRTPARPDRLSPLARPRTTDGEAR